MNIRGNQTVLARKVFHIIIGLNVGGAELMLKRLIESHQLDKKYSHSVISLTAVGQIGKQLRGLGIEVRALGMRTLFDIPRVLLNLMRIIRTERPDIVQTWMYHADLLGGLASRVAANRHLIWGLRATSLKGDLKWATRVIQKICALLSGWLPHTIVCAANASLRAHVALGYDSSRMVVVPNGFQTEQLVAAEIQKKALREYCGFTHGETVIGSVGRFHADKDQANFVRAAGLLAPHFPGLRFLLVGRDLDANNAELMNWIASTGYAERFVLLGQRADVPVCLSLADVFCLHSRTEGFPNVLGEAMAMGVPCVATDVGDAAFLMADTGVMVSKEDSEALAQGLRKLLEMTSGERSALGERAKARIYSEFTMDRCRARFDAIYEQVLSEARR